MKRYELCKKYPWFDWIDDNITWYIWDKPYGWYREIRHWCICNWNTVKYNLIKGAIKSYPWDGEYLDEIVYLKVCEIYNYFIKRPGYCSEEKTDDVIMWSGIAMRLGYVITHQNELWDCEGNIKDNTWKSWSKVYVNMKNKDRFAYKYIDYENNRKIGYTTSMYDHDPWELYIAKARKLFYRIIEEKGLDWWD